MLSSEPLATVELPGADRSAPRARVNAGDRSIDRRGRDKQAEAFLSYGFRPFFLFGSAFAALAVPLWLGVYFGHFAPVGLLPPPSWHAHGGGPNPSFKAPRAQQPLC
jgi:hypothetical protein